MVAASLRALDAEWFSGVLGCAVDSAVPEPMEFTGAAADMARFRLTGDGPTSLVAKIRGSDETRLALDAALGMYAREAHFYSSVAPSIPLRSPRCYYVGDGTATPLLLEDLAELRMGDQVAGLALADAERILDVLADLHSRYWDSPVLAEDWLASPGRGPHAAMVAQMVNTGVGALRERYAGTVPSEVLDAIAAAAPRWTEVLAQGDDGPLTLAHNDTRVDNIFFDANGEPIFIDWQLTARARGTQDVAQLLTAGMGPDDLREHWESLLRRYHERLDIPGYSWDRCRRDYRQNVLYTLGAGLALIGSLAIDDDRGLGDTMIVRALEHVADIDAFATVQ